MARQSWSCIVVITSLHRLSRRIGVWIVAVSPISVIADVLDPSSGAMNGSVNPGVSIRFGPVQDKDIQMKDADSAVNGHNGTKRTARSSVGQRKSYAEPESSEEDQPLVWTALHRSSAFPI